MAFKLGDHNIDEILFGVAQSSEDELLYTLDQLSQASIEIAAESTEFTDKNGNIVRTTYNSKTGTFNATNAFLHPAIMNASSGSEISEASVSKAIEMPKITIVPAGGTLDVSDAKEGTIKVVGIFGNGANDTPLSAASIAAKIENNVFTAPAKAAGSPVNYLVKYDRDVTEGIAIVETADKFPDVTKLTLYCSYVDPCSDSLMPCYVVLPRFMADPNKTISLSRETQEMDFNGNLNVDYCSGDKVLYYIYYPGTETVETGTSGN